ncbi:hypothetical protein ACT3TS_09050 [Specibacter sp. AOP5-B1-6]|uniref:hypothetical protein n=1 Tax=Specibacter sp. AOP5-B1-6 TaxID=3457653 RepID=UPI00402B8ABD
MVAINWQYSINGQMVHPTDEVLADWNYYADVTVSASVSLSISDAKEKLGLGPYARVCWVLIARSTGTPVITRSVPRVAVNGAQEIPLRIPASSLGGTLSVELVLSLFEPASANTSPFAPTEVGHVIYTSTTKVRLEGNSGQVAILPTSFKDQGLSNPSSGLWWLRMMSQDLDGSASGSIWVWLNTDNPVMNALIEKTASETSLLWLKFLKLDFTRQLLREALQNPDLDQNTDYLEGSLGALLISVVKLIGPSVEAVKSKYLEDPGRVEAELQGAIEGASQ